MVTFLAIVSVAASAVCALLLWRVVREDRRRSDARLAALACAIDGPRPATPPAGPMATSPLFEAGRGSAMQGRPLLKVAIGFAMAVALIVLIAMTGERQQAPRSAGPGVEQAPIELLSMRHTRSGDSLTVTGLVRNPGETAPARLIAVVLAFDRGGDFVASGRAPLEFPLLTRGDESPFQVTVPKVADVGRYRVSFRTESGVVPHVDRREEIDGRVATAR